MEQKVEEETKIVKADRKYRSSLFIVYGAVIIFGFIFIKFIAPFIIAEVKHLAPQSSFIISEIVVVAFLLVFIAPAYYLISVGKKIKLHAEFPYPGMKVIRDTKVISGKKALLRAKMLIYFGCFACVLAIISSISVHRSFQKLNTELLKIFHPSGQMK